MHKFRLIRVLLSGSLACWLLKMWGINININNRQLKDTLIKFTELLLSSHQGG